MKITLIHGQNHKGSTYHIARMTAEKIGGDIEEFFLPRDCGKDCLGCYTCLTRGREYCPHSEQVKIIFDSMRSADTIIIGSPTYVMEMTGQLKSFFDHLFSAWLSHRPEEAMFSKTAVVISTAAGLGMSGVTKSLAKQMFYLGIPRAYRFPVRVAAMSWGDVKGKEKISVKADRIARRILAKKRKVKPGIKLRFMFLLMRQMQKNNDWAPLDRAHWEKHGWLGKERPYLKKIRGF